jgi:multisubunit Na+/H+ antiporter MnhG subunit
MFNRVKALTIKSIPYFIGIIVGVFLWSLFELFFDSLKNADVKIVVAVVSIFGTITTGIIVAIINHSRIKERELVIQEKISERELEVQKKIREREIDESHRQKKVEIYNGFIQLISSYMQGGNSDNKKKTPNKQKTLDETEKFTNGILLWGGPEVITAYLNYRVENEYGTERMFRAIDRLLMALRSDIGLSNVGLDNYETIQVYLKDPNEISELV